MNSKRLKAIFTVSTKNPSCIGTQEGYTVEYKQNFGWGSMADYARAMAAMANNKGGHIIFGIKDKPHELIGLRDKNLQKFEERDLSEWSNFIREHFEPAIEFERDIIEFHGNHYGVIEISEAGIKPVICKKYVENRLKIGAIYYRYKAENAEIQYAELRRILDEETKKINSLWMDKIRQISLAGVSNTMVLNTTSGKLYGGKNSLYISPELLEQIRFVDKGKFVEKDGEPVLSIVGEVKKTEDMPISVTLGEKEVALSNNRIIESFLFQEKITNQIEYVKYILNSQARNLPLFYYIQGLDISFIKKQVGYQGSKEHILIRLNVNQYTEELKNTGSMAYQKKKVLRDTLLLADSSKLKILDEDLKYAFIAIRTLPVEFVLENERFLMRWLGGVYTEKYEKMSNTTSLDFKKAICFLDEVLNKQTYFESLEQ